MKLVAGVMLLTGAILGAGAAMEFAYFGPAARQFWVGVFTTPASILFAGAAVLLWRRGPQVRRMVLIAAVVMLAATIAATALDVMGPPATLIGVLGSLAALAWVSKTREPAWRPGPEEDALTAGGPERRGSTGSERG